MLTDKSEIHSISSHSTQCVGNKHVHHSISGAVLKSTRPVLSFATMLAAGYLVLSACAVLCEAACDQTRSPPFGPNITQYAVTGLPNVHYTLPASWAGQIRIPGTQDDALFFWLFEAEVPAFRNKLISIVDFLSSLHLLHTNLALQSG